jgi:anaerobic ribonucleoside-triphosphate reductase activating protein
MKIRIHRIIPQSRVDGPGVRTVVFLQGCSLACKGCQNRHIWPADGGHETNTADLAQALTILSGRIGNVTISGGEPFQQPAALAALITDLRKHGTVKHLIVYTGYTWEELHSATHPARPYLSEILQGVDVLVDGRFIAKLDDPMITYRGSRNQRPIDVAESLTVDELVVLDWDHPEVIIGDDGELLLPIGLADVFASMGAVRQSRMCGETVDVK